MNAMKSAFVLVAVLSLVACGTGGGTAPAETPEDPIPEPIPAPIVVLSPNGGEQWTIGATEEVQWDPGEHAGTVDIEVSTDGGTTWTALVGDTANDGAEEVTVPAPGCHAALVQVRATDGDPADRSDGGFQVSGPPADIGAGLPGGGDAAAWGDYDNDGDLDLFLMGRQRLVDSETGATSLPVHAAIWRNDAGVFTDIEAGLPPGRRGGCAWGDYDNDGDLDIAFTGREASSGPGFASVYRNDGGTFVDIGAGLPTVFHGRVAWGDYDNDGDLDLALCGQTDNGLENALTRIYRNDGGSFSDIGAGLHGTASGSLSWGDYDNDGDLDLFATGAHLVGNLSAAETRIYRNDGGTFVNVQAGLGYLSLVSALGDYDGDGDLDLAVSSGPSVIYRNDDGVFTNIAADLPERQSAAMAWGDYDNDGDLDLVLSGRSPYVFPTGSTLHTQIFRNDAGVFTDIDAGLQPVYAGALACADYDRDGDMDILVAGVHETSFLTRLYRNDGGFVPNTPPSAPTGLQTLTGGGRTFIGWDAATDDLTPSDALSYSLRVGTTETGGEVSAGTADAAGWRRVVRLGSQQPGPLLQPAILMLPSGVYYVSVQGVDSSNAGGPWSEPFLFTVP